MKAGKTMLRMEQSQGCTTAMEVSLAAHVSQQYVTYRLSLFVAWAALQPQREKALGSELLSGWMEDRFVWFFWLMFVCFPHSPEESRFWTSTRRCKAGGVGLKSVGSVRSSVVKGPEFRWRVRAALKDKGVFGAT